MTSALGGPGPASPTGPAGPCPYGGATGSASPTRLLDRHGPLDRFDGLDLFGADFVADPYPWLDALRADSPVHHDAATGLWLVSRYEDIRQVLLDPEAFRPDNAQHAVTPIGVPALRTLARAGFRLRPALANNATESHAGLRRVVTRFFNGQRVAAAVPVIERVAGELLDTVRTELGQRGDSDLFGAFAHTLPCRVMMELLGIDGLDPVTLVRWSDASLELFYGRPAPRRQLELAVLVGEFHRWLTSVVADRSAPADSFVGALARHRLPDGRPVDVHTAVGACFFVFIAGQSTTGQLIATVLRSALAEPGLWKRVAHEEGLAEAWVEEVLRREPPVTTWRRVTAGPVELGGVRLPAGAELLLMLMGSGSDTDVFDAPDRLRPFRSNVRHHLSFGAGRHRCPGASLARTEAAVALRAAARGLPGLRLTPGAPPPPVLDLLSFRAPLEVRVSEGFAGS
ncbi:cytochrome P450 [Streptomyces sp. Je 1-79]|uniref:cytochrome P450 n=1 Tax=Streptomyces sp. Je 1-79 TaxID=2943847 RepID=UPI0021A33ABD|nr:cytochrome P450 [Streptomyces sp. Je 1-79]MCT4352012.1 cytochrome P450 [Streptomyces sp. Je 1-79]